MWWRAIALIGVVSALAGGLGALGAVLTGALYVPILVPIAIGAGVGIVLGLVLYLLAVRSVALVTLAGALAWVVCLGVFHWIEYRYVFVSSVPALVALEGGPPTSPGEGAVDVADRVLVEAVGQGGFPGFLELRARSGIRLRGADQVHTGLAPGLAMWLADVLVGLVVVLRIGLGVARRVPKPTSEVVSAEAGPL